MTIEVRGLSVTVGQKSLLSAIDFDCATGEIVAIIGENGAGKSTLLKCIAGDYPDYQGRIKVNRKTLSHYSIAELARVRAVLPQHSNLNFPLSVTDVVRLPISTSSMHIDQQNHVINECLDKVNAQHLADRNYLTLSGGEKQRVQLARVLAQLACGENDDTSGRYLLLDEPTSALDLNHQFETLQLLRTLAESGIGIVLIVHDLNIASLCCDKIVLLKDGKITKSGTPANVIQANIINTTFGIDVTVGTHPDMDRPYLIPKMKPLPRNHHETRKKAIN